MAAMNAGIPMMGQGVNALQAIKQGTAAAGLTNQNRRTNALEQFMQTNGGAVMRGDEQALEQYAAFSPEAALGVQDTRQGMAAREKVMEYAETAEGRAVQTHAASLSRAEREALVAKMTQGMVRAAGFFSQGDLEGVNQEFELNGAPPVESLEQAAGVLAQFEEARKVVAGFNEMTGGPAPLSADGKRQADIAAGLLDPNAVGGGSSPDVQSSSMLPDGTGTVMTMKDGSLIVRTVAGDIVTGQPAMDLVRDSNAAYAEQQRGIYDARARGGLEARTDLAGEIARLEAENVDIADLARGNMEAATSLASGIGVLDDAIDAIDRGADSGAIYNRLPRFDEESASLDNAMNRLGLEVIGSVTFGALSAGELKLAMEIAAPRNLAPAALREWLVLRRDARRKAYTGLLEASQFFASGGTPSEWTARLQAADNRRKAETAAGTPAATENGDEVLTWNPETGKVE